MAASSFAPAAISLMPISEKLVLTNYTVWKAQVLAMLQGAQLDGFQVGAIKAPVEKITIKTSKEGGDEEVMNPVFATWKAQE
jgi:hypothetical protein